MKLLKTIVLGIMVLALVACSTGEKSAEMTEDTHATDAKVVGQEITIADVTSIDDMMAAPDDYLDKTVVISGKVIGRCGGSGCWISLDRGPDSEGLIIQTADKSFIFPEDCVDHNVTIQGKLQLRDPYATAEHEEHEEGEPDHVCPNPEYFFSPTGLKIEA